MISYIRMQHNQKTALLTVLAIIPGLLIPTFAFFAPDVNAILAPGSNYCVVNNCTPEECRGPDILMMRQDTEYALDK